MDSDNFWMVLIVMPFDSALNALDHEGKKISFNVSLDSPTHFCPAFKSKEQADKFSEGKYQVVELLKPQEGPR